MGSYTDTIVHCTSCGFARNVRFAYCLSNGWPKCPDGHGTLAIQEVEAGAIGRAIEEKLRPVNDAICKANELMDRGRKL